MIDKSCLDCNETEAGLIQVFNYGLFGENIYLCKHCYDLRYGNVYILKKKKPKKPSHLKLVKF